MSKSNNVYMVQTNERISVKTILYRIIGLIISFVINNLFMNNMKQAFLLTVIIETLQTTIYFIYEKIWNQIKWGISFEIDKNTILN